VRPNPGIGEKDEWDDMLELQGLTRRYGDLVALDDLSFTVAKGQMFAESPSKTADPTVGEAVASVSGGPSPAGPFRS